MRVLKDISPEEADALVERNAVLIDVRERHEQAVERIPGSIALPLSELARGAEANLPEGRPAIFLCASGIRTRNNAAAFASLTRGDAYCLAGGIAAWKRAGFPTGPG